MYAIASKSRTNSINKGEPYEVLMETTYHGEDYFLIVNMINRLEAIEKSCFQEEGPVYLVGKGERANILAGQPYRLITSFIHEDNMYVVFLDNTLRPNTVKSCYFETSDHPFFVTQWHGC